MKFLVDTSPAKLSDLSSNDLVGGQLLTPLTGYRNAGVEYGIDNGAFSGFNLEAFKRLLVKHEPYKDRCLFVAMPDVVGAAQRTLELFKVFRGIADGWPLALVSQDGMESLEIPWNDISAVFVGGNDPWKESQASLDIVKTAKLLGKHVHVGRINTVRRFRHFADAGADTCDGSGIAKYSHMLKDIEKALRPEPTLFDKEY